MKKHFKWLLGLVAGLLSAGSLSAADYNIVTYGAKEGGEVLNTDAIQRLIDRASLALVGEIF